MKILKKQLSLVLIFSMILGMFSALGMSEAVSAKGKIKLNKAVLKIKKGKSKTIFVKNTKKKPVWKIKTGKKNIEIKKNGKRLKVTGIKKGSAKVLCKVSGKKLICRIKILKADKSKESEGGIKASKTSDYKEEPTEKAVDARFVKQVSEVAMKLTNLAVAGDLKENKNVLVSPINIFMALCMVLNGAGGDTLKELKDALCGDIDISDFNKNMGALGENADKSANLVFNTANSAWIKKGTGWKLKDDFVRINKEYFNVECFEEKFDNDTVNKMNNWVKKETNGMIPQLIDKFRENDVLCLISALAFEGQWSDQYHVSSDKKTDSFTNSKGEEEKCILLRDRKNTQYIEEEKYTGFAKSYRGGKFDFVALLPKKDVSVNEVMETLAKSDFSNIYRNAGIEMVESEIPEFKYDYSAQLTDALGALGVKKMFDVNAADLTNMASGGVGRLFVSDILHKTHIELDRNGTKAAAATAILAGASSARPTEPKEVICDRPFVYAIVQCSTGIPVFVGVVNSVK